jgi:23S rRNA pseudouridine1911/1915/1917 synthase
MAGGENRHFRLVTPDEDDGLRLDLFVAGRVPDLSRTLVRKVVDLGGVHLAGRRVRRCSLPVRAGETVDIYLDGQTLDPFVLDAAHLVYRDRFLLAVNKPAGVETQPTPARYRGTLYAALLDYLQDPFRPQQRPTLGMVQRLDRETSGVMVFSIHPRAHKGLSAAFAGRDVGKGYLALVAGRMQSPAGEFVSSLARGRSGNRVRSVDRGGREAITRFRVLEEFADASLVEVEILTGRSHQIRVHFAEAGHPLLGDRLYGGPRFWHDHVIERQMLHALSLSLTHPVTGEHLELVAPLPGDFERLHARLRGGPISTTKEHRC